MNRHPDIGAYKNAVALVPSGGETAEFYAGLPDDLAVEARNAAERIRTRMRGSIFESGRDLLAVKARLDHGQFGAWLEAELDMTARTAENYMNAARLPAKYETVSHLPAAAIYALAAPATPAAVVDEVLVAALGGTEFRAKAIKERIADARQAARDAKSQAKKTAEQISKERQSEDRRRKSKAARLEREHLQYQTEQDQKDAKATAVAAFLVERLTLAGASDLFHLLQDTDFYRVQTHFVGAFRQPLTADELEQKFPVFAPPESDELEARS